MASQKNQHFVPKVHLAPFSTNGDCKSISLFNITRASLIHGASIKHQCSGAYFYGRDQILENLFGQIEGRYAAIVKSIAAGVISDADIAWLQMFMVLQHARTQAAVDQMREFLERAAAITLHGKTIKEGEKPDLSHNALVHAALRQFKWIMPYISDLKFCVFRNRTKSLFFTSDNPLIFTNRFYLQKLRATNWGSSSAGALLILPLGTRYSACLYDGGMYAPPCANNFVELEKPRDVICFNEMQCLNAHQNLYFSDPADGEEIGEQFKSVSAFRPSERVRLIEFVAIEYEPGRIKYELIEPGTEGGNVKEKLVLYQTPKPLLPRWPSILPFRHRRQAYSNGSAMGYVRKPEWLAGVKPPE